MKSCWIWNFGDWEIFHTNISNSRREQYDMDIPTDWRMYDVDKNIVLFAEKDIPSDGFLKLHLHGKGYLKIEGRMYPSEKEIPVTKGKHTFQIHVMNLTGLPAAYIESNVLSTDSDWFTLNECKEKIPAGFDERYTSPQSNPEIFPFSYKAISPVSAEEINGGALYDFGKEIFGFLYIEGVAPENQLHVSYGESREEALDTWFTVVREDVSGARDYKLRQRAFRYIFITGGKPDNLRAELEYQKLGNIASFKCDNEDVNKIWDMCVYTLRLNMREVLTEAVKRDRWLWGGDAYQAFKFIKYMCDDADTARRSIIGLRGKEPFCEHINTITDYSLYWVIGLLEYYENYGDAGFIRTIYPRAVTLMDFCRGREDENGFITAKYGDWIFIDWSDMDKEGALCAEQMLYIAANGAMSRLSEIAGKDGSAYGKKAAGLKDKVNAYFWNEEKGAYIDSFSSGKNNVTRHANIFAIMYDIADELQRKSIIKNVLYNDAVTKITTPYFEGYELDVMGKTGDTDYIYNMITSYWKGMLDLGATTVWEEFDPSMSGAEHYAMYGGKYQKSLCHAWGASPIYLLGKYFLGVTGTSAGYETFEIRPQLGRFGFIEGTLPVRNGKVYIYLSKEKLCVKSDATGGTLLWDGKKYGLTPNESIEIKL